MGPAMSLFALVVGQRCNSLEIGCVEARGICGLDLSSPLSVVGSSRFLALSTVPWLLGDHLRNLRDNDWCRNLSLFEKVCHINCAGLERQTLALGSDWIKYRYRVALQYLISSLPERSCHVKHRRCWLYGFIVALSLLPQP